MEAYNSLPKIWGGGKQICRQSVIIWGARETTSGATESLAGRVNAGVDSEAGDVTHE